MIRRSIAGVVLGVSLLLASLAWSGYLALRTVLDPDRSREVAEELLDNDEVRTQLAQNLATALTAGVPDEVPIPDGVVEAAAVRVLEDPAFEELVLTAFADSHAAFLGEGDPPEELDLNPLAQSFRATAVEAVPALEGAASRRRRPHRRSAHRVHPRCEPGSVVSADVGADSRHRGCGRSRLRSRDHDRSAFGSAPSRHLGHRCDDVLSGHRHRAAVAAAQLRARRRRGLRSAADGVPAIGDHAVDRARRGRARTGGRVAALARWGPRACTPSATSAAAGGARAPTGLGHSDTSRSPTGPPVPAPGRTGGRQAHTMRQAQVRSRAPVSPQPSSAPHDPTRAPIRIRPRRIPISHRRTSTVRPSRYRLGRARSPIRNHGPGPVCSPTPNLRRLRIGRRHRPPTRPARRWRPPPPEGPTAWPLPPRAAAGCRHDGSKVTAGCSIRATPNRHRRMPRWVDGVGHVVPGPPP